MVSEQKCSWCKVTISARNEQAIRAKSIPMQIDSARLWLLRLDAVDRVLVGCAPTLYDDGSHCDGAHYQ